MYTTWKQRFEVIKGLLSIRFSKKMEFLHQRQIISECQNHTLVSGNKTIEWNTSIPQFEISLKVSIKTETLETRVFLSVTEIVLLDAWTISLTGKDITSVVSI